MINLARLIDLPTKVLSLPEATIQLGGDESSRNIYENFTKPHPRYRLIQNKRWGVALLKLPDLFQDYLKGKDKQAVRTNRRRAMDLGFRFNSFASKKHLDEILAVNTSMEIRQAQHMPASYNSIERVSMWIENNPRLWGIFDGQGVLKAYAHVSICGEVCILSRLLGYGQDLENGIMYLLVSELVREMIERKSQGGVPQWGMYDMFFGASPGLRYFKERLGFKPFKVTWIWQAQG